MTPVTRDEAVELAVWLGELFTHLNETQVREFREYFERCGYDRDTITRGVRRYAEAHEFASINGIADSIAVVRTRDVAADESQRRKLDDERKLETAVDEYLAGLSEAEVYEIRETALKSYPAEVAERMRRKPVSRAGGIVRAVARGIVVAKLAEVTDAQQPLPLQRKLPPARSQPSRGMKKEGE